MISFGAGIVVGLLVPLLILALINAEKGKRKERREKVEFPSGGKLFFGNTFGNTSILFCIKGGAVAVCKRDGTSLSVVLPKGEAPAYRFDLSDFLIWTAAVDSSFVGSFVQENGQLCLRLSREGSEEVAAEIIGQELPVRFLPKG